MGAVLITKDLVTLKRIAKSVERFLHQNARKSKQASSGQ
jgi:cell division protein ZapA (FtsZ GTPase activity inhibitor)